MEMTMDKVVSVEEQNILRFVDAVEADKEIDLLGTNADMIPAEDGIKKYLPDELFVLRDKRYSEDDGRAFPKVEVKEIMEKCTPQPHGGAVRRDEEAVKIAKGDKGGIMLFGITRIVGYYSRVNAWNKSKIGELRDRGRGIYKLGGGCTESKQRHEAISHF